MLRRGLLAGVAGLLVARRAMAFGPAPANQAGAWVPQPGPQSLVSAAAPSGPTLDLNFTDGSTFNPAIVFTRASVGTYFDNTGTLQTAAINTPRIDFGPSPGANPLGLLIEEARTNLIRNPRCEGAVPGSPGTQPTDWMAPTGGNGVVASIVGSGTESGIPYVDIRWSGTATAATLCFVQIDAFTTAVAGQIYTESLYVRLVGGTLGNVQALSMGAQMNVIGGGTFTGIYTQAITPTTAALSTQRVICTTAALPATSTEVDPYFVFDVAGAGAVDLTIRIGAPQLELGSVATSIILPVAGTPAVSTRASDNANMPAAFWVAGSGTLVGESNCYGANPINTQNVCQLDGGSNVNRAILRLATGGNLTAGLVVSGNAVQANLFTGAITLGSPFKLGMSWSAGAQTSAVNGTFGASATGALNPVSITTLRIGNDGVLSEYTNGWARRIRYWPRALSSAELLVQTT